MESQESDENNFDKNRDVVDETDYPFPIESTAENTLLPDLDQT